MSAFNLPPGVSLSDEHINPGNECPDCGRPLKYAPARFEGEDTFCGYMPCICSWTVYLNQKQDDETFNEYRERINRLVCPVHGYADQCDCEPIDRRTGHLK